MFSLLNVLVDWNGREKLLQSDLGESDSTETESDRNVGREAGPGVSR